MNRRSGCFLGQLDPTQTIHIIGGGFSGLTLGFFLKKKGIPFVLYEKSEFVGGKIQTISSDKRQGESGAHAFFASPSMLEEIKELDLSPLFSQAKLKRKVYRAEQFRSPPIRIMEAVRLIFNSLLKKPPPFESDMSVAEYLAPLGNKQIQDEVFATFLVGIYGADTKDLHLQSIFKNIDFKKINSYRGFFKAIRKSKGVEKFRSVSFSQGMQELIWALRENIKDSIRVSHEVRDLPNNAVICTNAIEASRVLNHSLPSHSEILSKITYLPIGAVTVTSSFEITSLRKSFGVLFSPRTYTGRIRGILANFEIFPAQKKIPGEHSYTFIMATDSNLEENLKKELEKLSLLDVWDNKTAVFSRIWSQGLPLYNSSRYQAVAQLETLSWQNTALFGNYIGGISLREIFNSAKDTAERLSHERS